MFKLITAFFSSQITGFVLAGTILAGVSGAVVWLRMDAANDALTEERHKNEIILLQGKLEKANLDRLASNEVKIIAEKLAETATTLAAERGTSLNDYKSEIRNGLATACPDDPSYLERMQQIIVQ